jgi:hypothetical protein
MGQATNAIAFVGIVLDVMGTFLGVIHAIVLQRRIKGKKAILNSMAQVSTSLKAIQNLQAETELTLDKDQLREIDPERHIRCAQQLLEALEERFSWDVSGPFGLAQSAFHIVVLANPALGTRIHPLDTLARTLFGLGRTPLVPMALGVAALVVSVIMFAAESPKLSSEVWMTCVVVLGGVIALSLLPVTFVAFLINILSPLALLYPLICITQMALSPPRVVVVPVHDIVEGGGILFYFILFSFPVANCSHIKGTSNVCIFQTIC